MTVLRDIRQTAGVTQEELATLTGIGRARISLLECGHVQPTDLELFRIEAALAEIASRKVRQLSAILAVARGSAEEVGVGA